MPDDTSFHEFRALVLFASGRYSEAAETMHAVLAVAPGWDWTTMSGLYADHDYYIQQLRALEEYVRLNSRRTDARFLLAYHYITMGYPENAQEQLLAVLILNPDDRLASDLLSLVRKDDKQANQFSAFTATQTPLSPLQGRWTAKRPNGEIQLDLDGDKKFTWHYKLNDNDDEFSGQYVVSENTLVLATPEGSQMVGTVEQINQDRFIFRLIGTTDNDSGVEFVRR
jgi:tetratricopeptide (TPR) repeat protein